MKKFMICVLSLLLLAAVPCSAAESAEYEYGVSVIVDGAAVDFGGVHQPVIKDGRTLVPMRRIFDALGADEVVWNEFDPAEGGASSVTAKHGGVEIKLVIGSGVMKITESGAARTLVLDVPPELLPYTDGFETTMIPLRAVSETFGCDVYWDEAVYTVKITSAPEPQSSAAPAAVAADASDDFSPSEIADMFRVSVYGDTAAYIKDDGTVWYVGGGQVPGVSRAVQVAIGRTGGYALTDGGEVYSWGSSNEYGQLGGADRTADGAAQKIEGLRDIKRIGAGIYFGIALSENGRLYAWGRNDKGQLGNGTTEDSFSPTEVSITGVSDAAAGGAFAAAVDSGGRLWTWGENSEGQLGRGENVLTSSKTPTQVQKLMYFKSVYAGPTGAAAVRDDKSAYVWGTVYIGVLADGEELMYHELDPEMPVLADIDGYYRYDRPRRQPYCVYNTDEMELQGGTLLNIDAVSCGAYSFAAFCGGRVYMWGNSPVISPRRHSQIEHYYAMEYTGLSGVKAVFAGEERTAYALLENGDIMKISYGKTEKIAAVK